ncbi:S-adenosyl methyltransferase [Streptomyces sp. YIM 130001]|uniref:SAM-dependent methyltransferase n=1 Tax=Streptomyces sp. YIM 130001 TaxID=2259644 RepID=UPI000E64B6BF|nr:SAM-dependent methyltransferase [Streptomyces sp. YIM 130001]RII17855.1 S-adenosyl methyltransferase [Streptomyces sp. YIM 130001]
MAGPETDETAPLIDTSRPHPARMYDWFLGGKDNYEVDVAMGRQMLAVEPTIPVMTKVNRAFMHRATRWLAERGGIEQFLDIGTGIPTEPNLHQVAQDSIPAARIVYCDNDPIVLAHAEALLSGTPAGAIDYVQADARNVEAILEQAGKTLDFSRPVALSLISLLHFVSDEDGAYELVGRLVSALAPGSHLVMSHLTADFHPQEAQRVDEMYKSNQLTLAPRNREQFAAFFAGLELVEPGITAAEQWHPELGEPVPGQDDIISAGYVAVGRKP